MATTLTNAMVQVSLKWLYENVLSAVGVGNPKDQQSYTKTLTFTDGEGASQFEGVAIKSQTGLAASGTDSIDLSGTSLQDGFNTNVAAKAVKLLYILNTGTVALTWGGNANAVPFFAAANDKKNLPPGAFDLFCTPDAAGIAVGAGATDILDITNTSGSTAASYLLIVGYTK